MANWTASQTKAIEIKNKTMLISAAAGSGKTTVLIERIIRALTDPDCPADISRMLIVTFTRAAAAELKQRISNAITKALAERPNDRRLFKQLAALGSAKISTIDSFYGDVVRQNAQLLGIPSSLRVSDGNDLSKLRRRIMDDIIESGYSGLLPISENDFAECADSLSDMRNDSGLFERFYELYEKLSSHPKSIEFLKECAESYEALDSEDFFESSYGDVIREYVRLELEFYINILTDALDYFEGYEQAVKAPFADDLEFCREALHKIEDGNYSRLRDHFASYSPTKIKSPKGDDKTEAAEQFLDARNKTVRDGIRKLQKSYFGAGFSSGELKLYAKGSARRCRTLYTVLTEFDRLYREEKLSLGVCEFGDVKVWAYKLLVNGDGSPTELARSISEGFDCVFIDEYQDVDGVQDLIFKAISKPTGRFMVGDIKQSIYRFRGAEPTLFMNYRSAFPDVLVADKSDNCTIFMSENFRCDKPVIDFTNLVCSYLFRTGGKNIDYDEKDDLSFSKKTDFDYTPHKVSLTVIDRKASEIEFERAEAAFIASEINALLKSGTKNDGSRIKASDIAVLSRGTAFCDEVGSALDSYGIKHTQSASGSILDDPEVSLAISLLNVIDNPMRDIHTAAVLISPLFRFTADMLISIKNKTEAGVCSLWDTLGDYASENDDALATKCREFIETINKLREESRSLSVDKIILQIYSQFSFLSRSSQASSAALTALYENARSYEGDSFKGIYSYLRYIQEAIDEGRSIASASDDGADGVQLMTIHKSKGLEFPVCFVGGCSKPFNRDDAKDALLYSSSLGIATDLSDQTGFGKIRTPYRKSLSRFILNESAEEEMRVLYVALTRARERLYVTANPRWGAEREFNIARLSKKYGMRASILDATDYLSWILTATYGEDEHPAFDCSVIRYEDIPCLPDSSDTVEENEGETVICSDELVKRIRENLDYEYPYLHIANIPAKLSVSKLTPSVLDRNDEPLEADAEGSIDVSIPAIRTAPSFISGDTGASAAEKGIATHTFLQFCDFDNAASHGIDAELARLVELGFITSSMSSIVNKSQLAAFFESSLYKELRGAVKIYRGLGIRKAYRGRKASGSGCYRPVFRKRKRRAYPLRLQDRLFDTRGDRKQGAGSQKALRQTFAPAFVLL